MNIQTEVVNNERNDSIFQEEGDFIIKKMPKYRYEIRIIHDIPQKKKMERIPDKISSQERFTIKSQSKKSKINIVKKNINNINENYNNHRSKSPKIETNRFNPNEQNFQNENISYKKVYNIKSINNNYDKYKKPNDYEINNYEKYENNYNKYENSCNKYDNNYDRYRNNYDKYDNNYDKNVKYNNNYVNYKYDNNYNKNYNNYNNYDKDDNNYDKNDNFYENNLNYQNQKNLNAYNNHCNNNYDCDYFIDIYPNRPCICNNEIDRTLNNFYRTHKILNNNNYCNCRCRCGCLFKKRLCMNIYNENLDNNYYNFCSPPRIRYFREQNQNENPVNNLYYNEYNKSPYNYKKPKNDYYTGYKRVNKNYDTYFNYNNDINNKLNNTKKKIPKDYSDNYNNNLYKEISDFENDKKYNLKQFEKNNNMNIKENTYIKMNRNSYRNFNDNINNIDSNKINSNRSERVKNKILNKNYSSFITHNRYNYKRISGRNSANNFNNTINSFRRKTGNIMINKSSEKTETIKVIPIGENISPKLIRKSVHKPIKEKIKNKDGSTTNVMKQTTILTSIESRPIKSNNSPKNGTLVKEYVTKIYTTLTKDEIQDNDDTNNNINDIIENNDNINEKNQKNKQILNQMNNNDKNENNELNEDNNFKNKNLNIIQETNNILNMNKENNYIHINDQNEGNNNENYEITNNDDALRHNNKISSLNYSNIYSNNNDPSEQYNTNIIDEIIKYIKYLYNRYTNLTFSDGTKEESLSTYFLKLNDEDKKEVLNILNDNNIENKKIYNKLISILEENDANENKNNLNGEVINDEENVKELKNDQYN